MTENNPSSGQPLLEVESLTKSFLTGSRRRPITVVHDLSFQIKRGETLALVGESGSGKTTAGRCIAQLERPYQGHVRLDGVDLGQLRGGELRAMRRKLQMLYQDSAGALDSRMTILDSVAEPLHIHRIGSASGREAQARKMLERVGLVGTLVERKPFGLSGGQLQRAAIARAIITNPSLVILDEPVSALDVSVRAQVLNLLKELQSDLGLSYLFIVHDLALAEYISDQIVVLYCGRIMELGSADVVFRNAQHPYTEALLAAIPDPDPKSLVAPADANRSDEPIPAQGCPFAPRCERRQGLARCMSEIPSLRSVDAEHRAACHVLDIADEI